jgi:hypothetical protein
MYGSDSEVALLKAAVTGGTSISRTGPNLVAIEAG